MVFNRNWGWRVVEEAKEMGLFTQLYHEQSSQWLSVYDGRWQQFPFWG